MEVRKYGNRRLYDSEGSRYLTLEEIAERVRLGEDLRVVDAKTGHDLTQVTLAQLILELHYWEEMTSAAIAQVLEVPHGTAQTRIRRARQLLAEELKRQRGEYPGPLDFEAWAGSLRELVDRTH